MRHLRVSHREPAPFLKWVGGKGRLVAALWELLPRGVEGMVHVEPFLGGGAFYFARQPRTALLCDLNPDLIATYRAVQQSLHQVVHHLAKLARERRAAEHDGQEADHYNMVRDVFNLGSRGSLTEHAARFIYLNRTCFNGVYRVNKAGLFNVPSGHYVRPTILDASVLYAASKVLGRARLQAGPFARTLQGVGEGHFVYLDPPYDPVSKTANFTTFTEGGFDKQAQAALAETFAELDHRGAKVMLSNSATQYVRDLYHGYHVTEVQAARSVNSKGGKRGAVTELVVRNYQ